MSLNNNGKAYLACGVALALFGGFAGFTAVDKIQNMVPVVVATQNIDPRKQITDSMVKVIEVPAAGRAENSVDDPSLVVGGYSTTRIFANQTIIQPMVAKQFDETGASGLALAIPGENLRAVTFPATKDTALNGKIRKGDSVDILVTMQAGNLQTNTSITKTILQNVEVFDVGRGGGTDVAAPNGASAGGDITNITLLLTLEQAEVVKHAYVVGDVSYALNPGNTTPAKTVGVINKSFCERFGFSCVEKK